MPRTISPAQAVLDRLTGLQTKAAPAGLPGGALSDLGDPAPAGTSPVGAFAFLSDPAGYVQAWLVNTDGGNPVGYLRSAFDPADAVQLADLTAWQSAVEARGMIEQTPPTVDIPDDEDEQVEPAGQDESDDEPPAGDEADGPDEPAQDKPPAGLETKAARPDRRQDDSPGEQDDAEQTGIMIALMVDDGDASDLAQPDLTDATPAAELHVTLAYLGTTDDVPDEAEYVSRALEVVREIAATHKTIAGQVNGFTRLNTPGGDAFALTFDSPDIDPLRQHLMDALDEAGIEPRRDHGFTPHITLAYLAEGEDTPYRRATNRVMSFERITLAYGGRHIAAKLGAPMGEDEIVTTENAATGYRPDSTAPSVFATKAKPRKGVNPFAKTGDGKGGGNKNVGKVANGAYVSGSGFRGRVDLVVTNGGTVPGVESDLKGTTDSPVVRVVVYKETDGTWKATGEKRAAKAASLKTIPPLNKFGRKDAQEALIEQLGWQNKSVEDGHLPEHAHVDPVTLQAVVDRGVKSWPGAEHTGLTAVEWGTRRGAAFLQVAQGIDVGGYRADRELLPNEHPARRANAPEPVEPAAEVKSAALEDLPDPMQFAAELRAAAAAGDEV